jgi:hypothetical protein
MEDPWFEYNILHTVHENEGRLTQRDVSQRLGRSVASVNFALRLLAAKGLIKMSGANPRNLRYHLTQEGLLHKSMVAYNFIRRQKMLYEEVRKGLLEKFEVLANEGVRTASVYGWTPFTETAVLYLIFDSIVVTGIYVERLEGIGERNKIPFRLIEDFQSDCDVFVLMEPLPNGYEEKITTRKLVCFPLA